MSGQTDLTYKIKIDQDDLVMQLQALGQTASSFMNTLMTPINSAMGMIGNATAETQATMMGGALSLRNMPMPPNIRSMARGMGIGVGGGMGALGLRDQAQMSMNIPGSGMGQTGLLEAALRPSMSSTIMRSIYDSMGKPFGSMIDEATHWAGLSNPLNIRSSAMAAAEEIAPWMGNSQAIGIAQENEALNKIRLTEMWRKLPTSLGSGIATAATAMGMFTAMPVASGIAFGAEVLGNYTPLGNIPGVGAGLRGIGQMGTDLLDIPSKLVREFSQPRVSLNDYGDMASVISAVARRTKTGDRATSATGTGIRATQAIDRAMDMEDIVRDILYEQKGNTLGREKMMGTVTQMIGSGMLDPFDSSDKVKEQIKKFVKDGVHKIGVAMKVGTEMGMDEAMQSLSQMKTLAGPDSNSTMVNLANKIGITQRMTGVSTRDIMGRSLQMGRSLLGSGISPEYGLEASRAGLEFGYGGFLKGMEPVALQHIGGPAGVRGLVERSVMGMIKSPAMTRMMSAAWEGGDSTNFDMDVIRKIESGDLDHRDLINMAAPKVADPRDANYFRHHVGEMIGKLKPEDSMKLMRRLAEINLKAFNVEATPEALSNIFVNMGVARTQAEGRSLAHLTSQSNIMNWDITRANTAYSMDEATNDHKIRAESIRRSGLSWGDRIMEDLRESMRENEIAAGAKDSIRRNLSIEMEVDDRGRIRSSKSLKSLLASSNKSTKGFESMMKEHGLDSLPSMSDMASGITKSRFREILESDGIGQLSKYAKYGDMEDISAGMMAVNREVLGEEEDTRSIFRGVALGRAFLRVGDDAASAMSTKTGYRDIKNMQARMSMTMSEMSRTDVLRDPDKYNAKARKVAAFISKNFGDDPRGEAVADEILKLSKNKDTAELRELFGGMTIGQTEGAKGLLSDVFGMSFTSDRGDLSNKYVQRVLSPDFDMSTATVQERNLAVALGGSSSILGDLQATRVDTVRDKLKIMKDKELSVLSGHGDVLYKKLELTQIRDGRHLTGVVASEEALSQATGNFSKYMAGLLKTKDGAKKYAEIMSNINKGQLPSSSEGTALSFVKNIMTASGAFQKDAKFLGSMDMSAYKKGDVGDESLLAITDYFTDLDKDTRGRYLQSLSVEEYVLNKVELQTRSVASMGTMARRYSGVSDTAIFNDMLGTAGKGDKPLNINYEKYLRGAEGGKLLDKDILKFTDLSRKHSELSYMTDMMRDMSELRKAGTAKDSKWDDLTLLSEPMKKMQTSMKGQPFDIDATIKKLGESEMLERYTLAVTDNALKTMKSLPNSMNDIDKNVSEIKNIMLQAMSDDNRKVLKDQGIVPAVLTPDGETKSTNIGDSSKKTQSVKAGGKPGGN